MAFIDVETELTAFNTQMQAFTGNTVGFAIKQNQMNAFLYWLLGKNKSEIARLLSAETQTRADADTTIHQRIDALYNTQGAYVATLVYDLQPDESPATLHEIFTAGMKQRGLVSIPDKEYRIIFGQKNSAGADIIEKSVTYIDLNGKEQTAQISAAEAIIVQTDKDGSVKSGIVNENPFKLRMDRLDAVVETIRLSFLNFVNDVLIPNSTAIAGAFAKLSTDLTFWVTTERYTVPK